MVALLLVAASLGSSNFAAAVSMGVTGVDARTRLRVGLVFGAFEAGMPAVGLLIGDHLAAQLGQASRWIGGALLIGVGLYGLIGPITRNRTISANGAPTPVPPEQQGSGLRLLLAGLALSLDNLVVGFALGTYQVSIILGAVVIGAVSVAMSLAGLELGARIGTWADGRSAAGRLGWPGLRGDQLGSVILVLVGAAIAAGALR
jgi:manganese efflux pump family protein